MGVVTRPAPAAATSDPAGSGRRVARAVIWLPGLAVAVGAAVATAHGLYEVAVAAAVPAAIAWLYPLITDGLALVAYTATARLQGPAARYAWAVVVLAAGLSGLAQAVYLAGGATVDATPALRFGVGAWPAIAAAIVAHLLYLLATDTDTDIADRAGANRAADDRAADDCGGGRPSSAPSQSGVQRALYSGLTTSAPRTPPPAGGPADGQPVGVQAAGVHLLGVQPAALPSPTVERPHPAAGPVERPRPAASAASAGERARTAAARHTAHHGALPTVSELMAAAEVSRGTAAMVLKALRAQPTPLHLVTSNGQDDPVSPDARTQP